MNTTIRVSTPEDYPVIAEVRNAVWHEYPATADELRRWDEKRDAKYQFQRLVAERDGMIVGWAQYEQAPWMYHPRKFFIGGTVHPEYQGQGVGKALYRALLDALKPFDPLVVRTEVREDMPRSMRFLNERSFTEEMRVWESRLDVNAFDASPYAGLDAKVRAHGIEIKTLRELESDPDRNRKLYEAICAIEQDVPAPDPITAISFEEFINARLGSPNLLPDAYFIAVHGDQYVGTSALYKREANNNMWTGLTGVRREFRRKGIALALKLRGIEYSREHGHPVIVTDNESNNRPMLSINERLGFVRQPAWISFAKRLDEEI